MASADHAETTSSETSPTPPSLEDLSASGLRALLLPWIIGLTAASSPSQTPSEFLVLLNYRTGYVTMIEGTRDIESFWRSKDGPLPASKASIEAMPGVKVEEEGFECAICLTEFEINGEAKEMPCKHRYHSGCIEKWLGIHGSCPICRYQMPADKDVEIVKGGGDNEEIGGGGDGDGGEWRGGEGGFVFHVLVRSESDSNSGRSESGDDNDGPATRHMDDIE